MNNKNNSLKLIVAGLALALFAGIHPTSMTAGESDAAYGKLVRGWKLEHKSLMQRLTHDWLQGRGTGNYGGDLQRLIHLETGLAAEPESRLYVGAGVPDPARGIEPQVGAVVRAYLADHAAAVDTAEFFRGRKYAVLTEAKPEPEAKPEKKPSFWKRLFGGKAKD